MFRSVQTRLAPRANHPGIARLLIADTILCGSAGIHTFTNASNDENGRNSAGLSAASTRRSQRRTH